MSAHADPIDYQAYVVTFRYANPCRSIMMKYIDDYCIYDFANSLRSFLEQESSKSIFCFITSISTLCNIEQLQFSRNQGRDATHIGAMFNRWNAALSITRAQNLAWVITKLATRNMCLPWVIRRAELFHRKLSRLRSRPFKND